jgi:hypothetical protein
MPTALGPTTDFANLLYHRPPCGLGHAKGHLPGAFTTRDPHSEFRYISADPATHGWMIPVAIAPEIFERNASQTRSNGQYHGLVTSPIPLMSPFT